MRVNLQPVAKSEASLLSYIDTNFRRLQDALQSLTNIEQGVLEVTGSVEIDTGLPEVYNVITSLAGVPNANAAIVQGYTVGRSRPSNIILNVYDASFAPSNVAISVAWFAIGL